MPRYVLQSTADNKYIGKHKDCAYVNDGCFARTKDLGKAQIFFSKKEANEYIRDWTIEFYNPKTGKPILRGNIYDEDGESHVR